MFLLTLKNRREEGVYAVDDQYGNLVLFLFEDEDDATRYAMMLEEDEEKELVVVEIDDDLALKTCKMNTLNIIQKRNIELSLRRWNCPL